MISMDCGDSNCWFSESRNGMRTQSGCRCLEGMTYFESKKIREYIYSLRQERDRLYKAAEKQNAEVCEILGEALYGPTLQDAPGPVWAIHTAETLAEEAALFIRKKR